MTISSVAIMNNGGMMNDENSGIIARAASKLNSLNVWKIPSILSITEFIPGIFTHM